MGKRAGVADAESDIKRRIHHVGTGSRNARGHLDADAGPGTDGAEKDVERRIRRMGTGRTDKPRTVK